MAHSYRTIDFGVEKMPAPLVLPRHRHREGYANVVLAGRFIEASFAGRFAVAPGEVLLHGAFDCHANWPLNSSGPTILRLPWFDDAPEGHFHVADPDRLVRVAESDPRAAAAELSAMLAPRTLPLDLHWTDVLAFRLRGYETATLGAWAEEHDLAPATVSRGFARAFGTSPRRFQLEARARRAWQRIRASHAPLSTIAYDLGFADAAHMTRNVHAFTGAPPSAWRVAATTQSRPVIPD